MKTKTILLSVFAFAAISAKAQKGSWYLGGNTGFSTSQNKYSSGNTTIDGAKTTTWSFSPEVGTFLTNHVQLGVGLTITGSKQDAKTPITNINKNTSYGGTIYSRYFFGNEAFKPFVGLNILANTGKGKTINGNVTSKGPDNTTIGTNINAGFGYAISKRVMAVGSFGFLGYSRNTLKSGSNKSTSTSFGFDANSLGNRFNVGFYYTFCK